MKSAKAEALDCRLGGNDVPWAYEPATFIRFTSTDPTVFAP